MRVAFDHQIFSCQEHGGISRSLCVQARHLANVDGVSCRIVAPRHGNRHLRELPPSLVEGRFLATGRPDKAALLAANHEASAAILEALAPDVLHETYYTGLPPLPGPWRVVIAVYDMTHERYPAQCHPGDRTAERKREAVARADHILCPSESTRRDLMDILGVASEKISVVPLCSDPLPEAREAAPAGPPFFLYVGERGGYKNFDGLVRAFGRSKRLANDFRLVCAGGGDFTPEEHALFRQYGVADKVHGHPRCDDRVLARLYAKAAALVFPSLCEGFGLPLVEAMQTGCPGVCSEVTSLPEVGGEAVLYFDPRSCEALGAALERVAYDAGEAARLRAAGPVRARRFSPENCIPGLVAAYAALL